MRRVTKFRQQCCQNCKKKYNMWGERGNWISVVRLPKFLSYPYYQVCPAQNACMHARGSARNGNQLWQWHCRKWEEKKNLWQLNCRKWREKKNATPTTFFTTNYRWLVIISLNLNLTLRLLFYPNNNNQ